MNPPMDRPWTRRSFLRSVAQTSALLPMAPGLSAMASVVEMPGAGRVEPALRDFIGRYLEAMYAPGLTLALVHADGRTSTAAYGYSNVDLRQPVRPEMLFQIGSISKSFCALVLLQMHDEGKLDLHAPVLEYLPWVRLDMPYGQISAHHLLTHTAGIPGDDPLFSPDRSTRIQQTYAPGKRFWYSNLGFEMLGFLAAAIDGTTYASCLQRRILDPLGMTHTRPAIWDGTHPGEAQSYVDLRELAGGRAARLTPAPPIAFADAGGCVVATPADMAVYAKMLINGGVGPHGRIVSEASFRLFGTPYVDASEDFGPGFDYGYGMAVKTEKGVRILKHTGGMNSFASSLQVDLNGRVGALASINAMQGYRPNPVTTYALAVLRAEAMKSAVPVAEALDDPREIANAAEYAGTFSGVSGTVTVIAEGKTLRVKRAGGTTTLERAEGDHFVATDEAWQTYPWRFEREKASTAGGQGKVTELFYGPQWYLAPDYSGPKSVAEAKELKAYSGRYGHGTGYLTASTTVYVAKGVLYIGDTALEQIGEGLFRPKMPAESPERMQFLDVVGGKAQMVMFYGLPFRRFEVS